MSGRVGAAEIAAIVVVMTLQREDKDLRRFQNHSENG